MSPLRPIVCAVSIVLMMPATVAYGQAFPSKPIRIVTSGIGGSPDVASRLIAAAISGPLGQQVIVDNRGSGVLPGEMVAQAAPDGYTVLVYGNSIWIGSLLQNTPYDPMRDFAPVTWAAKYPSILVVHPSLPVRSVKELIALAKAKPGALNYSAGGTGGAGHLSGELFKALAGVNIVLIQYKSGPQEIADLASGQVQLTFGSAPTATPLIRAGRMRALAVTSAQPSALFPELPPIGASVPGYDAQGMTVMLAPAKTPAAVISRLNQEVVKALNTPDLKTKFLNSGAEIVASSPEELAATMKAEMARMGKVIKESGIRAD